MLIAALTVRSIFSYFLIPNQYRRTLKCWKMLFAFVLVDKEIFLYESLNLDKNAFTLTQTFARKPDSLSDQVEL